jgi:hypothetical protein
MHVPLQSTIPVGQRQTPASHVWPLAHGKPQAPQFVGSVAAATHRRPHGI